MAGVPALRWGHEAWGGGGADGSARDDGGDGLELAAQGWLARHSNQSSGGVLPFFVVVSLCPSFSPVSHFFSDQKK